MKCAQGALPGACSHWTPRFRPCACVRGNIVEEIKVTFNSVFKSHFPRSKSYFPSTAAEG